jgi:transposase
MNYVGIDIQKRYSFLAAQDEEGCKLKEARIEGNADQDYARFFQSLEGPSRVVLEACWNWGLTTILLEEIEEVEEVVLAHPLKTRLIADAQIKTDRLDAFGPTALSARDSCAALVN